MTTVLLIDDEPDTLSIYSMLLEMAGYRVLKALDGAQALKALETAMPDVIVTDWMMPGINGKSFCEQLRQPGSAYAGIPILVASAAMEGLEGAQKLYDEFLRKPLLFDELISGMERMLSRSRMRPHEEP
jgi:DNA-binding response OmpR family regulator